jgi:hypothetical protein
VLALAAALDLGFAAFHAAFWRLFGWPGSLRHSGRVNAAITQTLNVMLAFVFAAYGGALAVLAWRGAPVPAFVPACGAAAGPCASRCRSRSSPDATPRRSRSRSPSRSPRSAMPARRLPWINS